MNWATIRLILTAIVLVAGYLRDQQAKGIGAQEALKELKNVLSARVDAAIAARRQPDDPGVQPDDFFRD